MNLKELRRLAEQATGGKRYEHRPLAVEGGYDGSYEVCPCEHHDPANATDTGFPCLCHPYEGRTVVDGEVEVRTPAARVAVCDEAADARLIAALDRETVLALIDAAEAHLRTRCRVEGCRCTQWRAA